MDRFRKQLIAGCCALVAFGLLATDAAAWGPRTRRAITMTAVQMLRRQMPNAFKMGEQSFEADLLRGAVAGPSVLRNGGEFDGVKQAANYIGTEIQLLRQAKQYGTGHHFCYRMGVLASLASETILPYGCDKDAACRTLLERMNLDIDEHVTEFQFDPEQEALDYITNPAEYLEKALALYSDARYLIRTDYEEGRGYRGYLGKGAESLFGRSIETSADVWYTVLRTKGDKRDVKPSDTALTWYFVDAVEYNLEVRRDMTRALAAYTHFANLNPGILAAFEQVGDAFYAFGEKERGVREWQLSLTVSGSERPRIMKKLADHYLNKGKGLMMSVGQPGASKTALDEAKRNFELAFQYDQNSNEAETLIKEAREAIALREERRDMTASFIASAEKVANQAKDAEERRAWEQAMALYGKARSVYEKVDDEFEDYKRIADQGASSCLQNVSNIREALVEDAHNLIAKGDEAVADSEFDKAKELYASVGSLLKQLPEDETTKLLREESEDRIKKADDQRERWEAAQKRKREREQKLKEQQQLGNNRPAAPSAS
ncbi:MAG: hypothetical protein GY851_07795 [bacterium]|nr:hypothetical protein [bacterium]